MKTKNNDPKSMGTTKAVLRGKFKVIELTLGNKKNL